MSLQFPRAGWRAALAAVGAGVLLAALAPASAVQATTLGGPLVLMGIDAEDCGPNGHGPIGNYAQLTDSILSNTNNGGNGIAVIGRNGSCVTNFWNAIQSATGETVTFVPGGSISTVDFTPYQMIAVASDHLNTPGGTSIANNLALKDRRADIAAFVNGGGGLLGFSSGFATAQGGPYPYLADIGAFSFNVHQSYSNITPTSEGASVGITNAFDVCCWHDEYVSFPPFLRVLATNASNGRAAAIGGLNVVISDVQLSPPTQTLSTGDNATVTAAVTENGSPAVGTTVSFEVTGGPNTGATGTAITDSSGDASFSYSSAADGVDTVQASFVDSSGSTQQSNLVTVTWEDTNDPPMVSAGGPYTGDEGTPLALSGSATDPDGDTLAISWSYELGPGADAGATCSFGTPNAVNTTFECTDDGTYYVKLTANDGNGAVSDSVAASMLDNLAPSISSVNPSTMDPVAVNTPVTINAPFTDPGANDTHTCSVDWGDGNPAASGTVSGGACGASHSYPAAGVHLVSVTVTDDDGDSDTASYQYVVVYDPDAGFVTGGGWIDSPTGAYPADPSLTGKANFGFVSKYKKGATTPDGQTQFQFHAAGFNFHSTSYDWLVVAGPKAQYKGSGTVNGGGEYGFMLTASDGQVTGGGGVDRFRLKIWDKTTGDVVYDNQSGDSDLSSASDAIEGGSIVIHTKN